MPPPWPYHPSSPWWAHPMAVPAASSTPQRSIRRALPPYCRHSYRRVELRKTRQFSCSSSMALAMFISPDAPHHLNRDDDRSLFPFDSDAAEVPVMSLMSMLKVSTTRFEAEAALGAQHIIVLAVAAGSPHFCFGIQNDCPRRFRGW